MSDLLKKVTAHIRHLIKMESGKERSLNGAQSKQFNLNHSFKCSVLTLKIVFKKTE